jgi:hypothetical protein
LQIWEFQKNCSSEVASSCLMKSVAFIPILQDTNSARLLHGGTRWRNWLRHCATSRKVAGSIPDCHRNITEMSKMGGTK